MGLLRILPSNTVLQHVRMRTHAVHGFTEMQWKLQGLASHDDAVIVARGLVKCSAGGSTAISRLGGSAKAKANLMHSSCTHHALMQLIGLAVVSKSRCFHPKTKHTSMICHNLPKFPSNLAKVLDPLCIACQRLAYKGSCSCKH